MDGIKDRQKCPPDCEQHIFDIRCKGSNPKYDIEINFCPKFRRGNQPPEKTMPEYNTDKKYYTHAFVLGTELKNLPMRNQQDFMEFQRQIKDSNEKNYQIAFPRPNENNSYCSVCKQHFMNYFMHIRDGDHRQRIEAAIYNRELLRLCEKFRQKWDGSQEAADKCAWEQFMKIKKSMQQQLSSESEEDAGTNSIHNSKQMEKQNYENQMKQGQMNNDFDSNELEHSEQSSNASQSVQSSNEDLSIEDEAASDRYNEEPLGSNVNPSLHESIEPIPLGNDRRRSHLSSQIHASLLLKNSSPQNPSYPQQSQEKNEDGEQQLEEQNQSSEESERNHIAAEDQEQDESSEPRRLMERGHKQSQNKPSRKRGRPPGTTKKNAQPIENQQVEKDTQALVTILLKKVDAENYKIVKDPKQLQGRPKYYHRKQFKEVKQASTSKKVKTKPIAKEPKTKKTQIHIKPLAVTEKRRFENRVEGERQSQHLKKIERAEKHQKWQKMEKKSEKIEKIEKINLIQDKEKSKERSYKLNHSKDFQEKLGKNKEQRVSDKKDYWNGGYERDGENGQYSHPYSMMPPYYFPKGYEKDGNTPPIPSEAYQKMMQWPYMYPSQPYNRPQNQPMPQHLMSQPPQSMPQPPMQPLPQQPMNKPPQGLPMGQSFPYPYPPPYPMMGQPQNQDGRHPMYYPYHTPMPYQGYYYPAKKDEWEKK